MKKLVSLLLALVMMLSVAVIPALADDNLSVAIVVAGSLGDRSFYDSANEGLSKLVADFGVTPKVIECKEDGSLFESSLVSAAETCDVVVAVGWQFYDALDSGLAIDFPEVQFIFIDNELSDRGENLMSIIYAQNEGSFLVGYIASKLTKTNKIGVVGGQDAPTINDFIVGYEAGAKYGNANVTVDKKYAETYEDPSKGLELAKALYDGGCDIVFAVAGKTGEGVFEAAAETGNYAIGVDSDQKYINPDVILCSMVKDVGLSIYTTISDLEANYFGGTTWTADMASGYIGVGYGDDTMTQQVSDELKAEVEDIAQKIISGEIEVPTALN